MKFEYTVKPNERGQWEVYEGNHERPLASFAEKFDAVDYAHRLAETKNVASVSILK